LTESDLHENIGQETLADEEDRFLKELEQENKMLEEEIRNLHSSSLSSRTRQPLQPIEGTGSQVNNTTVRTR